MFTYLLILFLPIVKRQNTYIRDTPHFIRMIESLQASPNCTLVAYDCTSTYTNMEFNELKQAVNDVLPQVVSCQGLNNTVQKHQVVRLVETAHEQLLLVQRQIIPPNHWGIHGSNTVTRNLRHTSPPNTGTLDQKLATQKQNNNPRPIQGRWLHDMRERN